MALLWTANKIMNKILSPSRPITDRTWFYTVTPTIKEKPLAILGKYLWDSTWLSLDAVLVTPAIGAYILLPFYMKLQSKPSDSWFVKSVIKEDGIYTAAEFIRPIIPYIATVIQMVVIGRIGLSLRRGTLIRIKYNKISCD